MIFVEMNIHFPAVCCSPGYQGFDFYLGHANEQFPGHFYVQIGNFVGDWRI